MAAQVTPAATRREQFDLLANIHSHAPSSDMDGDIGWMPRLFVPEGFSNPRLIGEVSGGDNTVDDKISEVMFSLDPDSVYPDSD